MEESTGVKYNRKWPLKLETVTRNTAGLVGVFGTRGLLHAFFVLHSLVDSAYSAQTHSLARSSFLALSTHPAKAKHKPGR